MITKISKAVGRGLFVFGATAAIGLGLLVILSVIISAESPLWLRIGFAVLAVLFIIAEYFSGEERDDNGKE